MIVEVGESKVYKLKPEPEVKEQRMTEVEEDEETKLTEVKPVGTNYING